LLEKRRGWGWPRGNGGVDMAETTTSIRVDAETARLVKVAAAKARESMQAWLSVACRQRLEREGGHAVADRQRVASVEWES